jgi:hypothetical protein
LSKDGDRRSEGLEVRQHGVIIDKMSPTVFRVKNYRFYFLSNEENRIHIHVECESGEAKFWLEPIIIRADSVGLNRNKLAEIERIVEDRRDEIVFAWRKHFGER